MMRKDLILVGIVVATLTLMVIPLSQDVIDVLLALNMSLSVLLLMVALYLKHPSDFSTFPSVILIGTAFRLALSVGTTRLILSEAEAGQIIETFGEFVIAGSIAIGLVIFLIITVVQFLVVTKGAERVAEVGARFALDAMPGKQMSIDAELRAGNLDAEEATRLRRRLDRDSQFFGAMDGAMKFVKGDAIAGLIIICINLLGGIAVGMTVHGLGFGEAIAVFSLLTVGDGLVAQIPALLMSLCAGVIVTRVAKTDNEDLGTDIFKELVADPRVPGIASIVVVAMGFIPGFPTLVFVMLAAVLLIAAMFLRASIKREEREAAAAAEQPEAPTETALDGEIVSDEPALPPFPVSDRFRLVLGVEISGEADRTDLQSRLRQKFERLYAARGIRFPMADVVVSKEIKPRAITIELDEVPVFRATIPANTVAARGGADLRTLFPDEEANAALAWADLRGLWVPAEQRARLEALDYDIVPLEGALAHVAFRFYERNLGSLFSNIVFGELIEEARSVDAEAMAQVEETMQRPALYRLLRYLVEDGVPVRPLPLLVMSLHYWLHATEGSSPVAVAECLRGSMKRQLCFRIAGEDGLLGMVMLEPALETTIRRSVADNRRGTGTSAADDGLTLLPKINDALIEQFRGLEMDQRDGGRQIAIVCAADLRRRLRNYLAVNDIHLPVLAPHELASEIATYPLELLKMPAAALRDAEPARTAPREEVATKPAARTTRRKKAIAAE